MAASEALARARDDARAAELRVELEAARCRVVTDELRRANGAEAREATEVQRLRTELRELRTEAEVYRVRAAAVGADTRSHAMHLSTKLFAELQDERESCRQLRIELRAAETCAIGDAQGRLLLGELPAAGPAGKEPEADQRRALLNLEEKASRGIWRQLAEQTEQAREVGATAGRAAALHTARRVEQVRVEGLLRGEDATAMLTSATRVLARGEAAAAKQVAAKRRADEEVQEELHIASALASAECNAARGLERLDGGDVHDATRGLRLLELKQAALRGEELWTGRPPGHSATPALSVDGAGRAAALRRKYRAALDEEEGR